MYIYIHAGLYVSLDTVFVLFIVRCTSHFFLSIPLYCDVWLATTSVTQVYIYMYIRA